MEADTVYVISKDGPIKYVLCRPILCKLLTKWAVILEQYDIVHISEKAIKGQALANFQADNPMPDD